MITLENMAKVFTTNEMCEKLGVSRPTLRAMRERGDIQRLEISWKKWDRDLKGDFYLDPDFRIVSTAEVKKSIWLKN